jgi:hypothetical protein
MKRFALVAVVTVIVGFALWTLFSLTFVYSSGDRVGYVQKFSKKGWVFKTWEGELAMVNLPGALSERFYFSVPDDDVANEIQNHLGHQVRLTYEEHVGIPVSWFAETPYFVTGVRLVEPSEH